MHSIFISYGDTEPIEKDIKSIEKAINVLDKYFKMNDNINRSSNKISICDECICYKCDKYLPDGNNDCRMCDCCTDGDVKKAERECYTVE